MKLVDLDALSALSHEQVERLAPKFRSSWRKPLINMVVTLKKCDYKLLGGGDIEGGEEIQLFGCGPADAGEFLGADARLMLLNAS